MHIFQFHRTAYIASHHFLHFDTVGTGASINLGDSFLRTTVGISKVVTFMHRAAHYFKILHITDMRFYRRLKEIQRSRSLGVGFYNLTAGVMHRRHFVYKRYYIAQELHQAAYTHILACTYAENGEHAARCQSLTDALAHFILCQRVGFKEFLHQSFIMFSGSFHQGFVPFRSLFHFFSRDFLNGRSTAFGSP